MIIVNTYGLNIFLGKECLPYFPNTNSGNRFDNRLEDLPYPCNMK